MDNQYGAGDKIIQEQYADLNLEVMKVPQLHKDPSSMSMNLDLPVMERIEGSPINQHSVNIIDLDLSVPKDQLSLKNKKLLKKANISIDSNVQSIESRNSVNI